MPVFTFYLFYISRKNEKKFINFKNPLKSFANKSKINSESSKISNLGRLLFQHDYKGVKNCTYKACVLDPIDSIWEYPQRFIRYFSYSISASNNVEQFHTHTHMKNLDSNWNKKGMKMIYDKNIHWHIWKKFAHPHSTSIFTFIWQFFEAKNIVVCAPNNKNFIKSP